MLTDQTPRGRASIRTTTDKISIDHMGPRPHTRIGFTPHNKTPMQNTTKTSTKLVLNNVTISVQNFGSRLAIFLQGEKEAIEQRYYAFWNYGGTSGELEWWSDVCAIIWLWDDEPLIVPERTSPKWTPQLVQDINRKNRQRRTSMQKLLHVMTESALAEILNADGAAKGSNPIHLARDIAQLRVNEMEWVNWYQPKVSIDLYGMGTSVRAEKDTGNFDDDVVAKGLERNATSQACMVELTEAEEA